MSAPQLASRGRPQRCYFGARHGDPASVEQADVRSRAFAGVDDPVARVSLRTSRALHLQEAVIPVDITKPTWGRSATESPIRSPATRSRC